MQRQGWWGDICAGGGDARPPVHAPEMRRGCGGRGVREEGEGVSDEGVDMREEG